MGWVVNATPRPRYPRELPHIHCTGGWIDLGDGLNGTQNIAPPPRGLDPPPYSESLYRLSYPGPGGLLASLIKLCNARKNRRMLRISHIVRYSVGGDSDSATRHTSTITNKTVLFFCTPACPTYPTDRSQ